MMLALGAVSCGWSSAEEGYGETFIDLEVAWTGHSIHEKSNWFVTKRCSATMAWLSRYVRLMEEVTHDRQRCVTWLAWMPQISRAQISNPNQNSSTFRHTFHKMSRNHLHSYNKYLYKLPQLLSQIIHDASSCATYCFGSFELAGTEAPAICSTKSRDMARPPLVLLDERNLITCGLMVSSVLLVVSW